VQAATNIKDLPEDATRNHLRRVMSLRKGGRSLTWRCAWHDERGRKRAHWGNRRGSGVRNPAECLAALRSTCRLGPTMTNRPGIANGHGILLSSSNSSFKAACSITHALGETEPIALIGLAVPQQTLGRALCGGPIWGRIVWMARNWDSQNSPRQARGSRKLNALFVRVRGARKPGFRPSPFPRRNPCLPFASRDHPSRAMPPWRVGREEDKVAGQMSPPNGISCTRSSGSGMTGVSRGTSEGRHVLPRRLLLTKI